MSPNLIWNFFEPPLLSTPFHQNPILVRANYTNLEADPDKNIPKLENTYFLSEFRGESEFDMPKLPSLEHFEIIKVFETHFFRDFQRIWKPKP